MPATRSSSKRPRNLPLPHQNLKSTSPVRSEEGPNVLVLSSGEDNSGPRRKANRPRTKAKAKLPYGEVIEISSDEEDDTPSRVIQNLQKQLRKLQQENAKFRKDSVQFKQRSEQLDVELAQARDEITQVTQEMAELKKPQGGNQGTQQTVNVSLLEDSIACEICTMKMWSPYILPECGHTFCLSCLQDWFGTTLAQHMTAYPNFNVNRPDNFIHGDIRNLIHSVANPHMRQMMANYQPFPRPQYTCPTCRQGVKNRPIEDFALKAIVRTVAAAGGESSPRRPTIVAKGKGKAITSHDGPWEGFFPHPG